ncbi:MAG: DUF3467 domain-containing protein [Paludibacteraceae bacterium]|nr:DUF3467 domain-containing protein [Paludibacteraceae bacterium]
MENQLQLAIAPDVAQGKYANLALIGHSQTEFVLDFASVMPAQKNATVVSRIVLAPEHAKRLAAALQDNIQKFEANFGTITIKNNVPTGNMPLSFGGGEA